MKTQKELNKVLLQELKETKSKLENYKRSFEIEMNIKNGLYFFILTNDLFDLLKQFRKTNDYQKRDYHMKSLEYLVENLK
jgi:hypothetical protein